MELTAETVLFALIAWAVLGLWLYRQWGPVARWRAAFARVRQQQPWVALGLGLIAGFPVVVLIGNEQLVVALLLLASGVLFIRYVAVHGLKGLFAWPEASVTKHRPDGLGGGC